MSLFDFYSHSQSRAGAPGKTARWHAEDVSCLTMLIVPSVSFVCMYVCVSLSFSNSFFPLTSGTNSAIYWDWLTVSILSPLKRFQFSKPWLSERKKRANIARQLILKVFVFIVWILPFLPSTRLMHTKRLLWAKRNYTCRSLCKSIIFIS